MTSNNNDKLIIENNYSNNNPINNTSDTTNTRLSKTTSSSTTSTIIIMTTTEEVDCSNNNNENIISSSSSSPTKLSTKPSIGNYCGNSDNSSSGNNNKETSAIIRDGRPVTNDGQHDLNNDNNGGDNFHHHTHNNEEEQDNSSVTFSIVSDEQDHHYHSNVIIEFDNSNNNDNEMENNTGIELTEEVEVPHHMLQHSLPGTNSDGFNHNNDAYYYNHNNNYPHPPNHNYDDTNAENYGIIPSHHPPIPQTTTTANNPNTLHTASDTIHRDSNTNNKTGSSSANTSCNSSHKSKKSAGGASCAVEHGSITTSTANNTRTSRTTRVSFSHIKIREYEQTLGDNPCVSCGVPVQLDWQYKDEEIYTVDIFEADRISERRKRHQLLLDYYQRRDLLLLTKKHTMDDIDKATKETNKIKRLRNRTINLLPFAKVEEVVTNVYEKVNCTNRNHKSKKRHYSFDHTEDESLTPSINNNNNSNIVDVEAAAGAAATAVVGGGILRDTSHYNGDDNDQQQEEKEEEAPSPTSPQQEKHHQTTTANSRNSSNHSKSSHSRRRSSNLSHSSGSSNIDNNSSSSCSTGSSSGNNDNNNKNNNKGDDANLYIASDDSKYETYNVRVDKAQHDRAIEISLGTLNRPHMRAFHSSWFAFFVAFFMWFAITPLLSEVEITLKLSHDQIWTSSLCGTASTILMRLIMGPLCDKYGARICMALILLTAAIPTGLTGLIQTSEALCTIRAFIGIAGSSFVACQYWTSCMFTREVAGTANSLVAGWGNLGGGVTQIIMGSVLFPLFKLIYDDHDNNAELAWRTVFIIPALLSIVTAYLIVRYSDDSPKGNYSDRTRTQELMYVNTCDSFCSVIQSWNSWILFVQYACCFGVEVTMTNASALYFKDRFGQNTESAAALASIFGFMNLFARGFGGFFSDMFNSKYGVTGRLWWQFFTLLVQGAGILWFGFSRTLLSAIFALIFASLFVQSAEGSTFGIVPYVNPRFTGGIVGFVGAGGNVGGVAFAVMFRAFNYEKAFSTMAITVMASSFLSFFIYQRGLVHKPFHHVSDIDCDDDDEEDAEEEYDDDYEGEELRHGFYHSSNHKETTEEKEGEEGTITRE